jgi:methyltransferase OMS1
VPRRHLFASATAVLTSSLLLGDGSSSSSSAFALTPEQAATDYNAYASTYNQLDGGTAADALGLTEARRTLTSLARGHVLEIGVGTGLNLPYYDPQKVQSLTLVDISPGMLAEAKRRYQSLTALASIPVTFVTADVTSADLVTRLQSARLGSESFLFDTAVDTFSLCVMGETGAFQCLQQLRTVVKPTTGRLLLLENTRSDNFLLGRYQDATATAAAQAGGKGCVYNQNVQGIIRGTPGLVIQEETVYAAGLFRAFSVQRVT